MLDNYTFPRPRAGDVHEIPGHSPEDVLMLVLGVDPEGVRVTIVESSDAGIREDSFLLPVDEDTLAFSRQRFFIVIPSHLGREVGKLPPEILQEIIEGISEPVGEAVSVWEFLNISKRCGALW